MGSGSLLFRQHIINRTRGSNLPWLCDPKWGEGTHGLFQSDLGETFFSLSISEILKCRSVGGEGYVEKLSLGFHLPLLFNHQLPEESSCLEAFGQGGGIPDSVPGQLAGMALKWPQGWSAPMGKQLVSLPTTLPPPHGMNAVLLPTAICHKLRLKDLGSGTIIHYLKGKSLVSM